MSFVKAQTPPTESNISAVIVTYNPDNTFCLCVRSIMPQLDKIFIIDNSSDENNFEIIKNAVAEIKDESNIDLLRNQRNLGQAKALNQGFSQAILEGYEWILMLDQDSIPDLEMVNRLIEAYHVCPFQSKLGVIAANYTFKDTNMIKYFNKFNKIYFERDVVMVSGSLVSRQGYLEAGPFREEFFIDSIDTDYCLRLRSKGYRIIVAYNSQMAHAVGNLTVRNFGNLRLLITNHNHMRCYYMIRNGLRLVLENIFQEFYWSLRNIVWYFFVKPLYIIFFEQDKTRKIKSMLKGVLHAFSNNLGEQNKI